MVNIILKIERHSVLGMQIDYLEGIEKILSLSIPLFLSLSIFLLPAGLVQFFADKDQKFYERGIMKLPERWKKVIE